MSRSSRVHRAVVPVLLAAVLALAGCGSDEQAQGSGDGDGSSASAANEVSAAGVAFEAPEGWKSLDPNDAEIPKSEKANLAEGLGLTPEQLDQTISGVDLFLVDGDGPQDGFLSNINVLAQQGALPDDAALESQFAAIGAEVLEVSHSETGAGDAAVVEYTLPVADRTIEGVSYLVDLGEEIVTVTVSTPDRGESDEIGDTVGDTLTTAS
ncbi:hypothetical protein [Nocardioides sp.]|uniref:hypothetical protein n=1 Tax=Nocardioides sp. TaxID=35761 RepID=UPI002ED0CA17